MKTLLFLLIIVSAASAFGQEAANSKPTPAPDFRKAYWGMGPEAVKATEENKPSREEDGAIFYDTTVAGYDALAAFIFTDQKLVRGAYVFKIVHSNDGDFIEDFRKVESALSDKYGKSKNRGPIWKDTLYKDDPEQWGMAVGAGHLVYQAFWQTETTEILEDLSGDNFQIDLKVQYTSRALKGLEEKAKKKKDAGGL